MKIEELLFNDQPITINRKLARCLGLKEAVVFQQIHYWLEINKKTKNNFIEGRYWTYNSVVNWHKNEFDFLSLKTLQRTLKALEDDGLLLCDDFNKMKGDKTKWYSIDYEKLLEVCEKRLNEKELLSSKRSEIGKKAAIAKKEKNDFQGAIDTPYDQIGNMGGHMTNLAKPYDQFGKDPLTNLVKPIPKTSTKTSTEITISKGKTPVFLEQVEYFEKNICNLGQTTKDKFLKIVESNNLEFIKSIIDYCTDQKAKTYSYFEKTITGYLAKNINTKELLEKSILEFRKNMEQKKIEALKDKQDPKILNISPEEFLEISKQKVEHDEIENLDSVEEIKENIKMQIADISFKTWIKDLIIKKENNSIRIFAVNEFTKGIVQKKYELNIIKALQTLKIKYDFIRYDVVEQY